jgi:hypothetical protein
MCFRQCCHVQWVDFQSIDNTAALVLSSDICIFSCSCLTAHTHTHTHTYMYMCVCVCVCVNLKLRSYNRWILIPFSSFHSCLYEITVWMWWDKTAERLNSLKMVSINAERRRSEKKCLIWHTQYSALKHGFDKQCYISLCSSHYVWDQVQHPRKATGKL